MFRDCYFLKGFNPLMPLTAPLVLLPTSIQTFLPNSFRLPPTFGILIFGIFGILIFPNIDYFSLFHSVQAPYPIAPHAANFANGPAINTTIPHSISTAPSHDVLSSSLLFTQLIGFISILLLFLYIYVVDCWYYYVIIYVY